MNGFLKVKCFIKQAAVRDVSRILHYDAYCISDIRARQASALISKEQSKKFHESLIILPSSFLILRCQKKTYYVN